MDTQRADYEYFEGYEAIMLLLLLTPVIRDGFKSGGLGVVVRAKKTRVCFSV